MPISTYLLTILGAYLLGSIPTSVWVGKIFYGLDVRTQGSGNAGATNTFRVLGVKAGIPVLIIDILKGYIAVSLVQYTYFVAGTNPFINYKLLLGIIAVVGHIFPVFAQFKGGKGVATLAGVVIALHPQAALLAIAIFVVMLLTTRYVSLSSITAGISFPLLLIGIFKVTTLSLLIFALAIAILLLFTHQANIDRLLKREESKANLFRRRTSRRSRRRRPF